MECNNKLGIYNKKIEFDEACPAIYGFKEAWEPLGKIYKTSKIYISSPYLDDSGAAFLSLNAAKKILSTAEEELHGDMNNINLKHKIKSAHENVQALEKKYAINPTERSRGYFRGDLLQLSKKSIVDFVQENIGKYYKNEKLTPIIFGLEIEIKGKSALNLGKNFKPNLETVINKGNNSYTAAELRTIYKIVKEIPDEEIRYIANQSFRFVKVIKTITDPLDLDVTFHAESLSQPWSNQSQVKWENRPRKDNRSCYDKREGNLPAWVDRLIQYKNEMKQLQK